MTSICLLKKVVQFNVFEMLNNASANKKFSFLTFNSLCSKGVMNLCNDYGKNSGKEVSGKKTEFRA